MFCPLNLLPPGHFCCDDGTCIQSGHVCDNVRHCRDHSDEADCGLVIFPESYDKLAPSKFEIDSFKTQQQSKPLFTVNGNLTVLDLLDISEIGSTFNLYFKLDIKWFDISLKYQFLHDFDEKNAFEQEQLNQIWKPKIQFIHIENNDGVIDFEDTIFVKEMFIQFVR